MQRLLGAMSHPLGFELWSKQEVLPALCGM